MTEEDEVKMLAAQFAAVKFKNFLDNNDRFHDTEELRPRHIVEYDQFLWYYERAIHYFKTEPISSYYNFEEEE